ncbi:MAG: class I adenylate-forming enzyme family protein [Alphaproteobacteria bacterium]
MKSLAAALSTTVAHNGPRRAVRDAGGDWTWDEFGRRIACAAQALRALGLREGDRFAVFARNSPRFEVWKWAGFAAGVVPVPINWRLAPLEIAHILSDAACRHVLLDPAFADSFRHEALAPWRSRIVWLSGQSPDANPAADALLAQAQPARPVELDPAADALLLYTGGTTGRSKGVRLSHANILANALAFGLGVGARREDVYLHAAPMFHSADLLATGWMLAGATQAYLPQFSPAEFFRAVSTYRISATVTVPTMLMMAVSDPGFASADLSSLRTLIYGAAPMAYEWIVRVGEAFPHVDYFNCYGLTETAPDLTIFDAREFRAAIASGDRSGPVLSVGKPNALNELRVVDRNGQEVPRGDVGELIARGPNIMTGYLNLPAETASALRGGWLYTGDIARIDEHGYVYLLDRLKDLIVSGGENIYTSEVEAAIHRHPAVAECAVIGVPDERLGETPFAVIQLRPGARTTEAEIIEHCRNFIGGYKIPRRMAFVEQMPRSAMGKILKADLRRKFAASK